jgi:hypothetical protein
MPDDRRAGVLVAENERLRAAMGPIIDALVEPFDYHERARRRSVGEYAEPEVVGLSIRWADMVTAIAAFGPPRVVSDESAGPATGAPVHATGPAAMQQGPRR